MQSRKYYLFVHSHLSFLIQQKFLEIQKLNHQRQ